MKRTMVMLCCFLLLAGLGRAQQAERTELLEAAEVPAVILKAFTRDHPGTHGSWTKQDNNYKVEFTDRESHLSHVLIYDEKGNIIRRDNELSDVPDPIGRYYQENFPGENIRTWTSEDAAGKKSYYGTKGEESFYFDAEGKPKQEKSRTFSPVKDRKNSRK